MYLIPLLDDNTTHLQKKGFFYIRCDRQVSQGRVVAGLEKFLNMRSCCFASGVVVHHKLDCVLDFPITLLDVEEIFLKNNFQLIFRSPLKRNVGVYVNAKNRGLLFLPKLPLFIYSFLAHGAWIVQQVVMRCETTQHGRWGELHRQQVFPKATFLQPPAVCHDLWRHLHIYTFFYENFIERIFNLWE